MCKGGASPPRSGTGRAKAAHPSMKPSLIHFIHGFKTALAALLAYGITLVFDMEFGYWAVISTVIVMQVYVADSVEMCLYRLSGTMIGAVMGVAVMLVIPRTPLWIGAALFVTIGVCAFLTRYRTRYRMAAITVVIIILTGVSEENIVMFGISRVEEIGLGILCAFGVSVLVFPRRKADVLRNRLADQADACERLCRELVSAFIRRQEHVAEGPVEELVRGVRDNQAFFLNVHRHEARIYRLGRDHFQAKVFLMGRAVEHLRNMVRILNGIDAKGYDIIMSKELSDIADAAGTTLTALMTDRSDALRDTLRRRISAMEGRLMDIRGQGRIRRFDLDHLVQVISFYSSLKYFAEDILAGADLICKT